MPVTKEWGIYVYFAADIPDLQMQKAAWRTLETLASVGSNDKVGITVLMDLPARDTEYYLLPERPTDPCKKRWPIVPDRFLPNVNSASIESIYEFLEWSHRNCPAQKIALVFWGHGYAIDDYDPTIQQSGSFAFSDSDDKGRSFGRTANSFPGKRSQALKLLYDATHDSVLNNRDFANVIRDYNTSLRGGKKIDLLGLDCCNMAMAEVLSELQDYADYAVAAETGLPFQSWLSAPILKKFLAKKYLTGKELAIGAVNDFIESFGRSTDAYVGLSACDLAQCKTLETAVKTLARALWYAIDEPQNRAAINKAWFSDVSFVQDGLIDLYSFCRFLEQYMPKNTNVLKAARAVKKAVKGGVVVLSRTAPDLPGRRISLSNGLSVWFPPWIQFPSVDYFQIEESKNYFVAGYPQTRFAQATGWDKFLRKLLQLTQGQ